MLTRVMFVTAIALACSAEQPQVSRSYAILRGASGAVPAPVSIRTFTNISWDVSSHRLERRAKGVYFMKE